MLARMTDLYGAEVLSEGVRVGHAADVLVDLEHGYLRYLCLALPAVDHPVAMPMTAIARPWPEPAIRSLATGLTRREVQDLTAFDLLSHCHRGTEEELHHVLHWVPYWRADNIGGEPEMRTGREVTELRVDATDGPAGRLADLLVDLERWSVPVLALNTGEALARDAALAPIELLAGIDWTARCASLNATRRQFEASPAWDRRRPYTMTQLKTLRKYFGL